MSGCEQDGGLGAEQVGGGTPGGGHDEPVDLMALSTRTPVRPPDDTESYFWRDDHTVLTLRRVGRGAAYGVELADTSSGRVEVPEEFNPRWRARLMGHPMYVFGARKLWPERTYVPPLALLSPDGNRLLWRAEGARCTVRWIAASLTGAADEWEPIQEAGVDQVSCERSAVWARSSHEWVEVVSAYSQRRWATKSAAVRRPGDPRPLRVARFHIEEGAGGLGADERGMSLLVSHWCERMAGTGEARLYTVPLDDGRVEPTEQVIAIPACVGWQVWDAVLWPEGDRLAWITERDDASGDWYSLSVSSVSGSGWRVIGSTPGVCTKREHLWPTELRWLPDGKRVSFVHKEALWTVPVD